mmetsp:Transcript_10100/g.24108  ORF Transcript_10100/g.24108 Transcript_10100/m.24108 type:complete len:339 (+) Transcript_10100:48-1064(+)
MRGAREAPHAPARSRRGRASARLSLRRCLAQGRLAPARLLPLALAVYGGAKAGVGHALEELLHLRRTFHEAVVPKLVASVLDQLYEGNQQAPRVRSVHDEALQQDSGDLLPHHLVAGVGEEVQQDAAEVVRVRVRVAQVVRDGPQKQVPALIVEVVGEVREDVERRVVLLEAALPRQRLAMLRQVDPDVEEQRVQQGHVVLGVKLKRLPLRKPELVLDGLQEPLLARPHVAVHVGLQVQLQQRRGVVREDPRGHLDLRQQVDLQVGHERVGQLHVPRECRQDQVPDLDAGDRHDVAEGEVVLAEELREVVEKHQQHAHRALVEQARAVVQLHAPEVRL